MIQKMDFRFNFWLNLMNEDRKLQLPVHVLTKFINNDLKDEFPVQALDKFIQL